MERSRSSGDPSADPVASVQVVGPSRKWKEADEIKGIPQYPTVAELGKWRRDVRYAVAAAGVDPDKTVEWITIAENWDGEITEIPAETDFRTLDIKFGKAIRATVKGEANRELSNLEETVLRTHRKLWGGRQIYAWINGKFRRDARFARPQISAEIR